jgi:hypothetical protein
MNSVATTLSHSVLCLLGVSHVGETPAYFAEQFGNALDITAYEEAYGQESPKGFGHMS